MDTKLSLKHPTQDPLPNKVNSITGFHVEPTNICTLKCPGCARTKFIKQWPAHWSNLSLDIDVLMKFLDIDLSNKQITLCGNYGDPIYHPNLIDMVSQFKQRGSSIIVVTNGSYKKANWWEQLVKILDRSDKIIFSVDGTPENFTQYRINADWESIQLGMQISAAADCKTAWKYIPFLFNQDTIEQAQALSQRIGIDQFDVELSDRYDDSTEYLKPRIDLIDTRINNKTKWKQNQSITGISPKCHNGNEHYISADGFYSPCCFIADYRFYYKNMFGQHKSQYNIADTSLTAILESSPVDNFFQTLESVSACQFNCSKIIPTN